ncbi:MAG: Rne/Rng family ribonuclease [Candidatus Accumulibacter sp.]|jgi:ribonuclease E|nr:Rne/Rng family ribonuclease [Accumulibacter sp.]
MKRMLFNATQAEELRVAIVDGQKLIDLDIESATKEQKKSNIYKAVITRIEPSLEAAFVDYGAERHGFLPFKEISRAYFQPGTDTRSSIKEALLEGQELIVQVEKDERGNKGAAMTTFISLAGRYLVLMPNNPRGGGVSRRVEGEDRNELRGLIEQLEIPQGMSLIARTAAIGRSVEELQWDLNYLLQLWKAITAASEQEKAPSLIYQEDTLVIRAIRDYLQPDIGEILIDTDEVFEQARKFMAYVMPEMPNRVKRYRDDVPLFSRFQIEHQIESAYSREVTLPSGGAIVIDHTEALVSIDVNSGRSTRGADIEETAFKTNLEAAEEVARQLRLRDLGGLVVIDFIDMENSRNQREVESYLRENLRLDRARVQTGKISRFGLMELSRQRLRPALEESSYIPCPRCLGTGHIRSAESAALHILRILEEEAMKENTAAIHAQVPVDVSTFLFNEKRYDLQAIELRHKVNILLIPNPHLNPPQHNIIRLRHDEINHEDMLLPSYKRVEVPEETTAKPAASSEHPPRQKALIRGITITESAPLPKPKEKEGLFGGLFSKIASLFKEETKKEPPVAASSNEKKTSRASGHLRDRRNMRRRTEDRPNNDSSHAETTRKSRDSRQNHEENQRQRETKEAREQRRQQHGETKRVKEPEARPLPDSNDPPAAAPEENNGNSRRRGRRGGRRERGENKEISPVTPDMNSTEPLASETSPASEAKLLPQENPPVPPAWEETPPTPQSAPVLMDFSSPGEITAEDDEIFPTEFSSPFTEPAPLDAEEKTAAKNSTASSPPPAASETVIEHSGTASLDIGKAIETSGLVMVETKIAKMAPSIQEMSPEPRTPRRRRPSVSQTLDEPLVMVETRKPSQNE